MADQFDEVFANLRRGPWHNDPNSIPQERGFSDGQAESTGWLSDNSVTPDVIRASAVETDKLAANAVTAAKISAGAIETDKLAAGAVTAAKISAGAVETDKLAANAVTAAKIAANTITAAQIASSAITTDELAANAVTAAKIAANTVTANEIAANTLTAGEIAANAITATELATNSVQTGHIVVGNVTSSKIESVISSKSFGANDGAAGSPGVFFDLDSDTGLYRNGSGALAITANGSHAATIGLGISVSRGVAPSSDAFFDLGTSSARWDTVYRVSESAVSDANRKQDIADAPLGLDFVRSLRPRVYRWRDAADTQAREAVQLDTEAMERECRPHEQRILRIREQQMAGRLSDEDAEDQVGQARGKLAEIRERHMRPVREAQAKRRPGRRLHYGLVAQEVKAALDAAGVDSMDAAFWQQAPTGEQSLSYSELIPVLIRGMQEQAADNERLSERVAALEASRE